MDRGDGSRTGARRRHCRSHRPPLAGHPVHAPAVPGERNRSDRESAWQDLRRIDQGVVPAVSQGTRKGGCADRRNTQATGVHLMTTDVLARPEPPSQREAITKVSIIVSRGSLDGVYPALIMANGARAEGIEASLFFTFFGLDAIHRKRHEHIKISTVGNPGLHLATWLGGVPGMSSVMTHYLEQKMGKLDIPSIPEFIEMIADTGAGLYACKASVDLFGLSREDFIDQVTDIITVGEFYVRAAGGQIIFT